MRAVNLIPPEGRSSGRQVRIPSDSLGATHAIVAALVIVAAIVLLRVLAGNTVTDRTHALATIQAQVATEQAMAQRLGNDASFIQAAEQREATIRSIAEARFPWQQSLDQLAEVMPATTSLSSLSATSAGAGSTSATATGPLFTLTGCADTANQDGTATLLRRLQQLSGSPQIGFQSSTRTAHCGNSFDITVDYGSAAATTGAATTTPSTTSTTPTGTSTTPTGTSTTPSTTSTTNTAPTTTTSPSVTTTGSAG